MAESAVLALAPSGGVGGETHSLGSMAAPLATDSDVPRSEVAGFGVTSIVPSFVIGVALVATRSRIMSCTIWCHSFAASRAAVTSFAMKSLISG